MTFSDAEPAPAARATLTAKESLAVLGNGELELEGLLPWGSNYTFLVYVSRDGITVPAIYKPGRGERPLWDFPVGTLAKREVAAYFVSEATGWGFVPPTVYRHGPHGPGSVQMYVDFDPDSHYFSFTPEEKPALRRVVLFDYITNNADRKGGHVVKDTQGTLWLLDHGICFHAEHKLRTVIWDFAGLPIPGQMLSELADFEALFNAEGVFVPALGKLLTAREIDALRRRTQFLISSRCFPQPGPGRNYPWPPL